MYEQSVGEYYEEVAMIYARKGIIASENGGFRDR